MDLVMFYTAIVAVLVGLFFILKENFHLSTMSYAAATGLLLVARIIERI